MQKQLDKILDFMKSNRVCSNDETMETDTNKLNDMITQKNIEFPISSIEQLDSLESELRNIDFAKALVSLIIIIIS